MRTLRIHSRLLAPSIPLVLLALLLSGCFTFGAEEQKETASVSQSDVNWQELELDLDAYVDVIRIDGTVGSGLVTAIARLSALTDGEDKTVFADFELTLQDANPIVIIRALYQGSRAEQVRVDRFDVTVDNQMLVRLRKPNADRVVLNDTGAVDAIMGGKAIELNRTGFFLIETSSGSVTAEIIEEGDVITEGGSVDIEIIEPIPEGELFIQTRSGDIDLTLPRGRGWVFEFDTLNSPIDFSVGAEDFVTTGEAEYVDRFSVNRGGMLITIISDTGAISVFD